MSSLPYTDKLIGTANKTGVSSVLRTLLERALAITIFVFFMFPILWIVLTSLKTRAATFQFPPTFIFTPTLDAYTTLISDGFLTFVGNSILIAAGNTLLVIAVSIPAAYGMARFRAGGQSFLLYILSLRFIPPIVITPALFIQMNSIGLVNTRIVLVLLNSILNIPFAVWLLNSAFNDLDDEIYEAGELDGASDLQILYYLALPNIKPVVIAAAFITFIFAWNEFLFALVFTTGSIRPATVPLASLVSSREIFWNQIMAGATILLIPTLTLIYVGNKQIIRGMTAGSGE